MILFLLHLPPGIILPLMASLWWWSYLYHLGLAYMSFSLLWCAGSRLCSFSPLTARDRVYVWAGDVFSSERFHFDIVFDIVIQDYLHSVTLTIGAAYSIGATATFASFHWGHSNICFIPLGPQQYLHYSIVATATFASFHCSHSNLCFIPLGPQQCHLSG
jgi:hypothetical protein